MYAETEKVLKNIKAIAESNNKAMNEMELKDLEMKVILTLSEKLGIVIQQPSRSLMREGRFLYSRYD